MNSGLCGFLVVLFYWKNKKTVNGILVPVAHDQRVHDCVPIFSILGGASTLSHTQKEFIVKHGRLDRNRDLFLKRMIDSPNIPCSDQQIAAVLCAT